jgi:hypothetical protein
MEKTYAPHDIEQRLYQNWVVEGFFTPRVSTKYIS